VGFGTKVHQVELADNGTRLVILTVMVMMIAMAVLVLVGDGVGAEERGGIRIGDDSAFTEANGVRSGTGTAQDPYVISDWEINNQRDGVLVETTRKHFIVRNVTINASGTSWPLHLNNVQNGVLENIVVFGRSGIQFNLGNSKYVIARNITLRDGANVYIQQSSDCELSDVDMSGAASYFYVAQNSGIRMTRCITIGGGGDGFYIRQCSDMDMFECNSSDHTRGVNVIQSDRMNIQRCQFWNNSDYDLGIDGTGSGQKVNGNSMGPRGLVVPLWSAGGNYSGNTVSGKAIVWLIDQVNVTVDGGAGQVFLGNCTHARISNVTSMARRPINIWQSADVEMWNLRTQSANSAIVSENTRDLVIRDSWFVISEADFFDKSGVDLTGSWDVLVENVTIEGYVTQAGLKVYGGKDRSVEIHLNNVTSRVRGSSSFMLWNTDEVFLDGCRGNEFIISSGTVTEVSNCVGGGIRIEGGSRGLAYGNVVRNVTQNAGIRLMVNHAEAIGNTVSNCHYGVYAEASSGIIDDNVLSGCYYGILTRAQNTRYSGNTISGCTNGVVIDKGANVFSYGLVTNCTTAGIHIRAGNVKVVMTTVRDMTGVGILVDSVDSINNVNITKCTVVNCTTGIRTVENSGSFTKNVVQRCSGYGMVLNGISNVAFLNSFTMNNFDGHLYRGPQAANGGNNLWDNGTMGNFWSEYKQRYPSAAPAPGNVWDTPYALAGGVPRTDRYPRLIDIDIVPPVANAGSDVTVRQNSTVTLDSRSSRDDIGIAGLAWTFTYGGMRYNLSEAVTSFTFDLPGVYSVLLTVWDAFGNYANDTKVVTVLDTEPPVPVVETDVVADMAARFHVDASGSWDYVGIVEYLWRVDPDGLNVTQNGSVLSLIIDDAGTYLGTLRLSDAAGNWILVNITITIRDVVPPVARAGPDIEVEQGRTMRFDGSNSTDNVAVVRWTWLVRTNDGTVTLYGESPEFVFEKSGVFTVELEVADASGRTSGDSLEVTVLDTEAPVADAGDDVTVDEGGTVTFDGRSSTDNEGIAQFTWTFEYGGEPVELRGGQPKYTFHIAGSYEVTLRAVDARDNWGEDTMTVTVWDLTPPRADAGGDRSVRQGEEVVLDGSPSWDNVAVVSWEWLIDDAGGTVVRSGEEVSYTFADMGSYEVTLEVKDAASNEDYVVITITVLDGEAPSADAGPDGYSSVVTSFDFDGSASSDNVGVESYLWTFEHGGSEQTLSGAKPSFRFEEAGDYTVTLEVSDAVGNVGTDTMVVHVMPEIVQWSLGPITDGEGEPLANAKVRVVLGGEVFTAKTGEDGWVRIEVPWVDLVSPAEVTVSKAGWKKATFEVELDPAGDPEGSLPAMTRDSGGGDSPAAGALLAIVALGAVLVLARRGRDGTAG